MINKEKLIREAYKIGMTQYVNEINELIDFFIDKNLNNILEIGTFKGGNFLILAKLSSGIKISIDMKNIQKDECYYDYDYGSTAQLIKDLGGIPIEADSHKISTVGTVKEYLDGQMLDLLYIDGDHSYEGAKMDFYMYSPLVKKGGYIIFHDIKANINGSYVHDLWYDLKPQYQVIKEIVSSKIIDCGIGIFQK